MYELKTLQPQFDIKLPTCMYTLKNVSLSGGVINGAGGVEEPNGISARATASNATRTSAKSSSPSAAAAPPKCALDLDVLGAQIQQILKSSNDVSVIELRQDKVLQQLKELKEQMAGIRATLGLCQKGKQHTRQFQNGGLKEVPLHDIVINGHPSFIPYALLALKNAWRDLYTIDVKTFTHSTMADIGEEAREFERKLHEVPVNTALPKISVTLIWKNCEHTEMISSPTMYVPIYGEVNIIRYLGRIGPDEYRYESSPLCNEIDSVLDICYQLLRSTTPKGRAALVRALNQRLNKQQYFGGAQMSVADIGVHSSLKRMMATIGDKDLTPALNEWRKRAQLVTLI